MSRLREWEAALEAAVVAVEHEPLCRSNTSVTDGGFGGCDCTRDARIAKGIAAALIDYVIEFTGLNPAFAVVGSKHKVVALAAFTEASR